MSRDAEQVRRAQLMDTPDALLADELERRGHAGLARLLRGRLTGNLEPDDEEGVIAAFLGHGYQRAEGE